jgi:hypothetical protein
MDRIPDTPSETVMIIEFSHSDLECLAKNFLLRNGVSKERLEMMKPQWSQNHKRATQALRLLEIDLPAGSLEAPPR